MYYTWQQTSKGKIKYRLHKANKYRRPNFSHISVLQFFLAKHYTAIYINWESVQVNLFQKHLFLHQLTHNTTKDCSLNYKFSRWKFQAQNIGRACCVHKLFWMSKQKQKNNLCTQHVLPMFWSWNFHVLNW